MKSTFFFLSVSTEDRTRGNPVETEIPPHDLQLLRLNNTILFCFEFFPYYANLQYQRYANDFRQITRNSFFYLLKNQLIKLSWTIIRDSQKSDMVDIGLIWESQVFLSQIKRKNIRSLGIIISW